MVVDREEEKKKKVVFQKAIFQPDKLELSFLKS
jgi:hypothetical protein